MNVRGDTLLNVPEQLVPGVLIELAEVSTDIKAELGKDAVNGE